VAHHLIDAIVGDLFDLTIPSSPPSSPPSSAAPLDPARYAGTYRHGDRRRSVSAADGTLLIGEEGRPEIGAEARLVDATTFVSRRPASDVPAMGSFVEPDGGGRPRYLHIDLRAYRRE
jgi:hypothetical protein